MQIKCTLGYYDAYFKWHMPIWRKICRAEQRYIIYVVFVTVERNIWKNPKHSNICKLMQCCAPDFFPKHALGDGPAFWFFQKLQITIKNVVLNVNLSALLCIVYEHDVEPFEKIILGKVHFTVHFTVYFTVRLKYSWSSNPIFEVEFKETRAKQRNMVWAKRYLEHESTSLRT